MLKSLDSESVENDTRQQSKWQKIIGERTVVIAFAIIIIVAIAIAVPMIVITVRSSSANKGMKVDVLSIEKSLNGGDSEQPNALDDGTKEENGDSMNKSPENTDDQNSHIQVQPQKAAIEKMVQKMVDELAKYNINVLDQETFSTCMKATQNCSCIDKRTKVVSHITKDELSALHDIIGFLGDDMNAEFEVDLLLKFKRFNLEYERHPCDFAELKKIYYTFRKDAILIETHNRNPDRLYNMGYNRRTGMRVDYTPEVDVGYGDLFKDPKKDIGSGQYSLKGSFRQSLHEKYTPLPFDRTEIAKVPKATFTWQDKGYVAPALNQGICGICWGMSSIATLETFMAVKRQRFEPFSVQQLLDCVSQNHTCLGGAMEPTAEYIKTHKMCTEDEYPYTGQKGACDDKKCKTETLINEIAFIDYKGAKDFLQNHGAFSIDVDIPREFTHYESGVFNTTGPKYIRHAMTVVGYGRDTDRNVDYWIVKNSWGTDWGEDGFVRILDEPINGPDGTQTSFCGVTERASGFL